MFRSYRLTRRIHRDMQEVMQHAIAEDFNEVFALRLEGEEVEYEWDERHGDVEIPMFRHHKTGVYVELGPFPMLTSHNVRDQEQWEAVLASVWDEIKYQAAGWAHR